MDVAPFRGLRFDPARISGAGSAAEAVTAPPYDVIRPEEHRRLLERSPYNITRLTLGSTPGEVSSYEERAGVLREWIEAGILRADDAPCLYVYEVDYPVPGAPSGEPRRARLRALTALGRVTPFEEGIVLPHEQTFPKVVDDRLRLLEATRANLESLFLLYTDRDRSIDALLDSACAGQPLVAVEARPGERHAVHAIRSGEAIQRIVDLLRDQRPIIADGHHRYTTALRYLDEVRGSVPGAGWRLMTLANLHGDGLSILATHRLVRVGGADGASAVLRGLRERLSPVADGDWDISVETTAESGRFRFPAGLRSARRGVGRTGYALLHDVVLGTWLREWLPDAADDIEVSYYKEGTGEDEALRSGRGDLLFRMRPVGRDEFQEVVRGGEVFPHKTTYFYPKLWSGLIVRVLDEPAPRDPRH